MNSRNEIRKIVIMAGGTGGHIFPGLAVAEKMKERGWDVSWLGTRERMEARIVPEYGYPIRFIDVVGLRGNGLLRLLKAPLMLLKSVLQAKKVLDDEQPDVVLGMGGYASGPGGIAAWLSRVPLILHEQNAIPGLTNKILSRFADRVLIAFPGTELGKDAITVGNPLRQEIIEASEEASAEPSQHSNDIHILIVGGSLGARIFNEQLPRMFADVENIKHCHITHQTGRGNSDSVKQAYADSLPDKAVNVVEFIQDMADEYAKADLIICRSGALTVSELAVMGKAAIFIPFPHAVDDHQTRNAAWLAASGAAKIVKQDDIDSGALKLKLDVLLANKSCLDGMGKKAASVAIYDASKRVADFCEASLEYKK